MLMTPRRPILNVMLAATLVTCAATTLAGATPARHDGLRVGMTAAFVSEAGVYIYKDITDYLQKRTGVHLQFVEGFSYTTVNHLLLDGSLDLAFVCGLPYVMAREARDPPAVQPLAGPVMKGARYENKPQYFSDVIVRADSPFHSFEDLRGHVYVYNEETSNSGYNMPRYYMAKHGYTHGFFKRVLRSGSHENSVRMVANGEADASSVDSMVLDYMIAKDPEYARKVRVILSNGPAPVVPLVSTRSVDDETFHRLQDAIVQMDQTEEGRKILDDALLVRFAKVTDADYDKVREMRAFAHSKHFDTIR